MNSISNMPPPTAMDMNPAQMKQKITERFQESDVNEDGVVSETEVKDSLLAQGIEDVKATEMVEKLFKHADADENGEISTQEHNNMLASMEERMSQLTPEGYDQKGEGKGLDAMTSLVESLLADMDDDNEQKDQLTEMLEKMKSSDFSKEDFSESISVLNDIIPSVNVKA